MRHSKWQSPHVLADICTGMYYDLRCVNVCSASCSVLSFYKICISSSDGHTDINGEDFLPLQAGPLPFVNVYRETIRPHHVTRIPWTVLVCVLRHGGRSAFCTEHPSREALEKHFIAAAELRGAGSARRCVRQPVRYILRVPLANTELELRMQQVPVTTI